jgi:internalin A
MSQFFHLFKNRGDEIYNDVVFPGAPFILGSYSYNFTITPRTPYWRIGIRLSKTSNVEFFHPEHRYKEPEFYSDYVDIHLAAGEWNNEEWKLPSRLQLCQRNVTQLDHVVSRFEDYKIGEPIYWSLEFDSVSGKLHSYHDVDKESIVVRDIPIPGGFRFFKLFAWADGISFEIGCAIIIDSLQKKERKNKQVKAIKVGNITFRSGDMFHPDAINNSNLIILPASATGHASHNIINRAAELGIPYPTKNEPGNVHIHAPESKSSLFVGYGFSYDESNSSAAIIEKLCNNLLAAIISDEFLSSNITGINLPMLGAGSGSVSVVEIAKIYNRFFNEHNQIPVIASIPGQVLFDQVKSEFEGRYLPIDIFEKVNKPDIIRNLESELSIEIEPEEYFLNMKGQVAILILNNTFIPEKNSLRELKDLETLSLYNCQCSNFSFIKEFSHLGSLYLNSTKISDYSFLSSLHNLVILDIGGCQLPGTRFLKNLINLRQLYVRGTGIDSLNDLVNMGHLEVLDASNNFIELIGELKELRKLRHLNLSFNSISHIEPLYHLIDLRVLDVSHNSISSFDVISHLIHLIHLKSDANPFIEKAQLILKESENHLPAILNAVLRTSEADQVSVTLPAKVLILGNHTSGKTSLLEYVQNGAISRMTQSTHIIQIEKYPKQSTGLPDAIFFDFGGQDYYHGIYRAFLSGGSIYLILWNAANDVNEPRLDRNNIFTQHFTLQYWISQKSYMEQQKFGGITDPALLIQTYADKDGKKHLSFMTDGVENQYYVCLASPEVTSELSPSAKNKIDHALQYLKWSIQDLIEEKKTTTQRPEWFIDFLQYILHESDSSNHKPKDVFDLLPYYRRLDRNLLDLLRDDLDQLHKKGLVLYYKDTMPDTVWLNPVSLTNYIHMEILTKERLKDKRGQVDIAAFDGFDHNIIQMLLDQKVLFKHRYGKNGPEYIIPNFLPLSHADDEFNFLTFELGKPTFTLKFENFIPFGLMNQIICFFGQLPQRKKFWRDQLLFSFQDKAKVLIHADFKNLEMKVYCSFIKETGPSEKSDILKYLFFGIIGLYWDLDMPEYAYFIAFDRGTIKKDQLLAESPLYNQLSNCEILFDQDVCRPTDLYISLDEKNFIRYQELCSPMSELMITAFEMDGNHFLTSNKKIIPIYSFQLFTKKTLKRRKRVAISYSKKDLDHVLKFAQYLEPLIQMELIEKPWFCTLLEPGEEWEGKINHEFEQADIIVFMISENMMGTPYVRDNEIKNAIDRYDYNSNSIRIVPILLVPYNFKREGKYNLARFSAFPFMLKPVNVFTNQHIAWYTISEMIRLMLERHFDPIREINIPADVMEYLKRIAEGKAITPIG